MYGSNFKNGKLMRPRESLRPGRAEPPVTMKAVTFHGTTDLGPQGSLEVMEYMGSLEAPARGPLAPSNASWATPVRVRVFKYIQDEIGVIILDYLKYT